MNILMLIIGFFAGMIVLKIVQSIKNNQPAEERLIPKSIERNFNKWTYEQLKRIAWNAMEIQQQNDYKSENITPNKEREVDGKKIKYYEFEFKYQGFNIKTRLVKYGFYNWVFFVTDHEKTEVIRSYCDRNHIAAYDSTTTKFRLYRKFTKEDIYNVLN